MPLLVTMRTAVLAEADSTGVVDSATVDSILNECLADLYDLLVASFEEYFVVPTGTLLISSGSSSVPLPVDFLKAKGVEDLAYATHPRDLPRFNWGDRNRRGMRKSYAIIGTNLEIRPADVAPGAYRLFYVPHYVNLSADDDDFTVPNNWHQLAVLNAAARVKELQQQDGSSLTARAERIRQRIEGAAKGRDQGEPQKVRDVRGRRHLRQLEGYDPEPF